VAILDPLQPYLRPLLWSSRELRARMTNARWEPILTTALYEAQARYGFAQRRSADRFIRLSLGTEVGKA
jgi:hypothetical protein